MKAIAVYLFWPNPGGWSYGDTKVMVLLGVLTALFVLSFAVRIWRSRLESPITRKLSARWSSGLFWFSVVGAFLVVCRIEFIQFLAMRLLLILWGIAFALFFILQFLRFRSRHYTVVGRTAIVDERERYLPRRR